MNIFKAVTENKKKLEAIASEFDTGFNIDTEQMQMYFYFEERIACPWGEELTERATMLQSEVMTLIPVLSGALMQSAIHELDFETLAFDLE